MQAEYLAMFGALLAMASASDVAERRIPNALVAPFAVGGVAAQGFSGGASAALGAVLSGVGVFALLLLPWAKGKLGGGDLKLAAATAIWLGPSRIVAFVMFSAMAGIPVALVARAMHRLDLRRMARATGGGDRPLGALASSRETVPLAVAITLGAFAALRWSLP